MLYLSTYNQLNTVTFNLHVFISTLDSHILGIHFVYSK